MIYSRFRELIREGIDPRIIDDQSVPHGGKGGAPPPPDYAGAAREQSAASKEIATQQTWANRPTQNTPWGSTTWGVEAGVDPSTGQSINQWTQNTTLNPQLQNALNEQLGIQSGRSQLAGGFMGRVANEYAQPFNWGGLPAMANAPDAQLTRGGMLDYSAPQQTTQAMQAPAFADQRQQYTQAMWDQMNPQHQLQEQQTRTMLANQGFTPGSQGYNQELQRLQDQQGRERWNAIQAGGLEQQRMNQQMMGMQQQAFGQDLASQQAQNAALNMGFGQNLSANAQNFGQMYQGAQFQNQLRQQAIAEEAQRRGMSLNEMNALLTGQQVGMPGMPSFMGASAGQAPNLLGAAQSQGNYNMQNQQMQNQANAGLWGGLGELAGSGALLFAMSDARLKTNIEYVFTLPSGINVYDYDMEGRRERGVMAQEVLDKAPHLVAVHPSGYLMVNYGGL